MGNTTRDAFHNLIDFFSPGSLRRRDAEEAYAAMKMYPDFNVPRDPVAAEKAGYYPAKAALERIGIGGPSNLFQVFEGMNRRGMGVSGLIRQLHKKFRYPEEFGFIDHSMLRNNLGEYWREKNKPPYYMGNTTMGQVHDFLDKARFMKPDWAVGARNALQSGRFASVMEYLRQSHEPSIAQMMSKFPDLFKKLKIPYHFSVGGAVPGIGTGDSVPSMLTPGEIVLNSSQQVLLRQKLGLASIGSPQQLFSEIAQRHAAGGIVEGLDWANIGVPSPYSTPSQLGYSMKRDIARLVGIEIRAREIDNASPTGTLHYEQHNTYHELPKDPFAEARSMKQAVSASFHT
jgi:hypothetical protein